MQPASMQSTSTVNVLQELTAVPPGSRLGSQDLFPIARQTLPNNLDNPPKTVFADNVSCTQGLEACEVDNLRCAGLHDDAGSLRCSFPQRRQHLLAFGIGQVFVNQDQVECVRIKQRQRFLCSPYSRRIETCAYKVGNSTFSNAVVRESRSNP